MDIIARGCIMDTPDSGVTKLQGGRKSRRGIVVNFNFFFVGLMICYLMCSLLVWVFHNLTPN